MSDAAPGFPELLILARLSLLLSALTHAGHFFSQLRQFAS